MKYTQIEENLIDDIYAMIAEYKGSRREGRFSLKQTNKGGHLYMYDWQYIQGSGKKAERRYKWIYKGRADMSGNADRIKDEFNPSIPTMLNKALKLVIKRQELIKKELNKREIEYIQNEEERLVAFSEMIEQIKDEHIDLWFKVDEFIRRASELVKKEDEAIEYERKSKYFNQETN